MVLAVAALAGCGGGDRPDDGRLGRADLGRAATAICERTSAPAAKLTPPADPDRVGPYLRRLAAAGARQLRELQALQPDGDAALDWRAFMTELTRTYALVDRLAAADGRDAAALRALSRRQAPLTAAATRAGARGCVA